MYSPPNIVRVTKSRTLRWAGSVALMGRGVYRALEGKPEGKRPLGRSRHRWRIILKSYMKYVNGGRTGLVTFCVETAFYNGLLKERYKGG